MKTPVHDFGPTQPSPSPLRGHGESLGGDAPGRLPGPGAGPALARAPGLHGVRRAGAGLAARLGDSRGRAREELWDASPGPRPRRPAPGAPPPAPRLSGPSPATPPPGALPKEALGHCLGSWFCLPHSDRSARERGVWWIPYKHGNEKHPRLDPIGLHLPALVARLWVVPAWSSEL